MQYVVDKKITLRIDFPPADDGTEGWAEVTRLSAGDYEIVDMMCRRVGIAPGSIHGLKIFLERSIKAWSLPLPCDSAHIRESLETLHIDLLNFLGKAVLRADRQLDEEETTDLSASSLLPSLEVEETAS